MPEIQCWEGDGQIPPEVSKLIKDNEALKERIMDLEGELVCRDNEIRSLREVNKSYGQKLYAIERVLQHEEKPIPDPTYEDPNESTSVGDFLTEMAEKSEPQVAKPHERIDLRTGKSWGETAFDTLLRHA